MCLILAIIEIIKCNPNYKNYVNEEIIINDFIFAELCYNLIKGSYPDYENYLNKCIDFITSVDSEVIKEAMKFRHENKKRKLSIVDCVSYFQAKDFRRKFLTGNKEFELVESVEFVK